MEQGRQIVFVVLLTVVSALLSVSETRSISSLKVSQMSLNLSGIFYADAVYKQFMKVI